MTPAHREAFLLAYRRSRLMGDEECETEVLRVANGIELENHHIITRQERIITDLREQLVGQAAVLGMRGKKA